MPAPTTLSVVFDCLEYALSRITHANGFRTDGVLVDRSKDPRLVRQDKPEEYARYNAALTLTRTRRKLDREKSMMRHTWDCHVNVMGIRTMTVDDDEAGRTLDELAADLQDDVRVCLLRDHQLAIAAAAIGVDRPNVTGLSVDEVREDEGANFPDAHFVVTLYFRMDERTGFPGT